MQTAAVSQSQTRSLKRAMQAFDFYVSVHDKYQSANLDRWIAPLLCNDDFPFLSSYSYIKKFRNMEEIWGIFLNKVLKNKVVF